VKVLAVDTEREDAAGVLDGEGIDVVGEHPTVRVGRVGDRGERSEDDRHANIDGAQTLEQAAHVMLPGMTWS
jgi:hypothetical protein